MSTLANLNWAYNDEIIAKRRATWKAGRNWKMSERHGVRLRNSIMPTVARRLTKLELGKIRKIVDNH